MKYLRCYKCYDEKGNRYAIFAKQLNEKELEVWYLKCSRKDQFSKELAREVYERGLEGYHPTREVIQMGEGDKPTYVFNIFCKKRFYKKHWIPIAYKAEILTDNCNSIATGQLKLIIDEPSTEENGNTEV